jgi:hypothetical protein
MNIFAAQEQRSVYENTSNFSTPSNKKLQNGFPKWQVFLFLKFPGKHHTHQFVKQIVFKHHTFSGATAFDILHEISQRC